jgi:hypothetical protein
VFFDDYDDRPSDGQFVDVGVAHRCDVSDLDACENGVQKT